VAADGAGADVQLQLGGGHAAAVGHRLEHAQQANVGIADLAQHGSALGGGVACECHEPPTFKLA